MLQLQSRPVAQSPEAALTHDSSHAARIAWCRIWATPWASMWWCSTALTKWTTRAWARSTRVWLRVACGAALMSSTVSTWMCSPCVLSRYGPVASSHTRPLLLQSTSHAWSWSVDTLKCHLLLLLVTQTAINATMLSATTAVRLQQAQDGWFDA